MLAFGRGHGFIPEHTPDPCAPVRKNPKRNAGRILSADGLAALGLALKHPGGPDPDAYDAVSLILLTGCRSGEILRLTWEEVRGDRLKLRKTKTGPRDVLLCASAKNILRRRKVERLGLFVFPATDTLTKPRPNINAAWRHIKAQAGVDPKLRLHDLRHSYASHALMSGETMAITGKLLGHANPASTERYAHYDGAFLSAAAERISERVARAMD